MNILKYKTILLSIGLLSVILSCASVFVFGLNPSIDFSGGSLYEVAFEAERPSLSALDEVISPIVQSPTIQYSDSQNVIIKSVDINIEQKQEIDQVLESMGNFEEVRLRQIGPSISGELVNKSLFAIGLVILIVVLFIAYTFRSVSHPVASWKYGLVAIVALLHDTIIPIGIFAFLGTLFIDFQIDVLFITAILATLGYSINDTIVIFDRVRENLSRYSDKKQSMDSNLFESTVSQSLSQSIRRSLFTSLTTFGVLISLFFVGGDTTQPFALVLAIGVLAGTYSSLCIACPLLVWIEQHWREKETSDDATIVEEEENLPDDIKRFLAKQKK